MIPSFLLIGIAHSVKTLYIGLSLYAIGKLILHKHEAFIEMIFITFQDLH